MDSARLQFLGAPRVECDGQPVRLDRRKASALLVYLVCTRIRHSREALAAIFWPETEAKRAFAYLRTALWVLKKTPLSACLVIERDSVAFEPTDGVQVDIEQFRQLLVACDRHDHGEGRLCSECLSKLEEAVTLYTADFLAGFTLPDSPEFDEWQSAVGEELRRELAGALERLVLHYTAVEDFTPAIRHVEKWISLDVLEEPPHRHLMASYALSGLQHRALRHFEEYSRILEDELGTAPDEQTRRLFEEIRSGNVGKPADRRRKKPAHNIPTPTTPFVGRSEELDEIKSLLSDADCRLLTIAGVGGGGKTRLAIEVAKSAVDSYEHGVCFVSLAPVTTPEFVALATVDALPQPLSRSDAGTPGGSHDDSVTPETALVRFLQDKRMLLVYDNMEHLPGAAKLLTKILEETTGVRILVTSRQRLHIRREWVFDLVGLRYPTSNTSAEASLDYGAIQLFQQCARRTEARFRPTGDEAAAIGDICRLLEGIPLGIELGASWVSTLSCREIAEEIAANIDFLTTGLGDFPDRHRSLRAVFDQSWRLLLPDGRTCFRKLAVFRGGFTRRAAEEVAGANVAALASLVDKSMLRRASVTRYEMLEVLRQFAEERLLSVPHERDVVRDRHALHYLGVLAQSESGLKSSGLKKALLLLREELGNVRAAWRWGAQREMVSEIRAASTSLFLFYDIGSRYEEGAEMFREARQKLGDPPSEERRDTVGFLAAAQAWFMRFSNPRESDVLLKRSIDYLKSYHTNTFAALPTMMAAFFGLHTSPLAMKERLESCIETLDDAGDAWGAAMAREALSYRLCKAHPVAAQSLAEESLRIRLDLGDPWGKALSLHLLGKSAEYRGDYETARRRFTESKEAREELGEDPEGILDCISGIGQMLCYVGEYDRAAQIYAEGLEIAREMGSRYRSASLTLSLGIVALHRNEQADAERLGRSSLMLFEQLGNTAKMADSLALLGHCLLRQGNEEDALSHFEQCLLTKADHMVALIGLGDLHLHRTEPESALGAYRKALRRAQHEDIVPLVLRGVEGLAHAFFQRGDAELSAELIGFVTNHRGLNHDIRCRVEAFMPTVKAALPESTFQSAVRRGAGFDVKTLMRRIEDVDC